MQYADGYDTLDKLETDYHRVGLLNRYEHNQNQFAFLSFLLEHLMFNYKWRISELTAL